MEEVVTASGHHAVTATHPSTLEITRDPTLTPAGDCIVGVAADRGPADFDPTFVSACRSAATTITATVEVDGRRAVFVGRGDPDLTFGDPASAVVRTSNYIDDRTVMIGANGAAEDLDRAIVEAIADGATVRLRLSVDT